MGANGNAMFLRLITLIGLIAYRECASNYSFSSDFLFGASTSAYQIEGAWNESGRGESIWDYQIHNDPRSIRDLNNADIACDSYHKYKEDVRLLKELGAGLYRFSVSWSRIYPDGFPHNPNQEGLAYYSNLIDALLAENIVPVLTIYHWDLPERLQEFGGWTNSSIVELYTEYARILLDNYSDRVKYWVTFNEPFLICTEGYGGPLFAPRVNQSGIADYQCAHNLIKSHAAVYHLFNNTYRSKNNAKMGIVFVAEGHTAGSSSAQDIEAAERSKQFKIGLFANPIFGKDGDYPKVMRDLVAKKSAEEGFSKSRLPEFTPDEIKYIKGTSDFFGANHYTTKLSKYSAPVKGVTSYTNDMEAELSFDPSWPKDPLNRFAIVPWGFREVLVWIKNTYNNPEVHITENGSPDSGGLEDNVRVTFIGLYLEALLQAINEDKVNIRSYSVWTLMDNFSWVRGYSNRLGLYQVNMSDPNRPRTAKLSAKFYKEVIANRVVGDYPPLPNNN
ncbi:myrosinase 1-like [Agrilus planipennis]|uniref:Myrosinase 1-like n=1 Tax=Agrilus planipennis TaxID=224129 RepID=A0A1W4WJD9_AGRPL|nr:myrosinase 1-like [Agrilus planipennis]